MQKNARLRELRAKKILTIPEFMVLNAWFFGDWESFKKGRNLKALRLQFANAIAKAKKFKQWEIAQSI